MASSVRLDYPITKSLIIAAIIAAATAMFYFAIARNTQAGTLLLIPGFAGVALILLITLIRLARPTVISFDENGIFDPRLGIGPIAWEDIKEIVVLDKPRSGFGVGVMVKDRDALFAYSTNFLKSSVARYLARFYTGGYLAIKFYDTAADPVEFQMAAEAYWKGRRNEVSEYKGEQEL